MGLDQDDIVLAPWTTVRTHLAEARPKASLTRSFYPVPAREQPTMVDYILVRTRKVEDNPAAVRQITELLRKRHKIEAGQRDDFLVRDMAEVFKARKPKDR